VVKTHKPGIFHILYNLKFHLRTIMTSEQRCRISKCFYPLLTRFTRWCGKYRYPDWRRVGRPIHSMCIWQPIGFRYL